MRLMTGGRERGSDHIPAGGIEPEAGNENYVHATNTTHGSEWKRLKEEAPRSATFFDSAAASRKRSFLALPYRVGGTGRRKGSPEPDFATGFGAPGLPSLAVRATFVRRPH